MLITVSKKGRRPEGTGIGAGGVGRLPLQVLDRG